MDAMSRGVLKRKLTLVTGRLRVRGQRKPLGRKGCSIPSMGGLVLSRQKGKGSKTGAWIVSSALGALPPKHFLVLASALRHEWATVCSVRAHVIVYS